MSRVLLTERWWCRASSFFPLDYEYSARVAQTSDSNYFDTPEAKELMEHLRATSRRQTAIYENAANHCEMVEPQTEELQIKEPTFELFVFCDIQGVPPRCSTPPRVRNCSRNS